MGWFKKLTGVSSKKVMQVAGAVGGAYLGGPQGASLGYNLGSAASGDFSSLLGNVVNGAVGMGQDYLQAQINLAQQKDLAKYNAAQQTLLNQQAFDNNVKMWNMQNEYNSPVKQMERLEAAGMNKNMVYGGGNVTGNTAGSAPQLEPAKFDTGSYRPVDTRMQRAQIALALESQHQQVRNQAIENDLARQRLVLAAKEADRADKLANAQIYAISQNLGLRSVEIRDRVNLRNDTLAWHKYQDAWKAWDRRRMENMKLLHFNPSMYNKIVGREPMYMDFLE